MLIPWDATLPSEQRLTFCRLQPLRRRPIPQRNGMPCPKDLRNAIKHLSNDQLDLMHAATVEELDASRLLDAKERKRQTYPPVLTCRR